MGKGRKKVAAKRAKGSKEDMVSAVIPAPKKRDWKEGMPDRKFKNERQVDIAKLDNKCHGIPTIERRGLKFWFNALEGYNKEIVVEFYQNMVFYIEEPDEEDYRVESKVGRIPILITPDEIAQYLNYKRPPLESVNYPPRTETRPDKDLIKAALYEDIGDYEDKYASGSFKEEYRFINKVINANLYPRGSESLLRDAEAELLYAFMNDKYVFDVAEMIFYQIVNFQRCTHPSAKMPFPCMITKVCQAQGVKGKKYEKLEPLSRGPLNQTSVGKSKSHSTALSSSKGKGKEKLTDLPNENAKPGAWLRKLCCDTSWIITEIKKSKKKEKEDRKKMKQTRKEIRYLKAENDWLVKQVAKSTKTKFVPPTEVEVESEESEDDEEEDEPPLVQTQVGRTVPHGRGPPGYRGKKKSTVRRRSKVLSPVVSSKGDDDEEDDNSDDDDTTTDEEENEDDENEEDAEEENEDDENEEDAEEENEEDAEEENEEDAEDTDTVHPSKKAKKQH